MSGGHLCRAEAPTEAAAETPSRKQKKTGGETPPLHILNYYFFILLSYFKYILSIIKQERIAIAVPSIILASTSVG